MLTLNRSYLFDTTVFIDIFRGSLQARQLLESALSSSISVGYSIITEAELWVGIKDEQMLALHVAMLRSCRRYPINVSIARRAGTIRRQLVISGIVQPKQGPFRDDCLIAATAEYHGLTVCTRNTRHFSAFAPFGISALEYA